MKVILQQDVRGQGKKGQLIDVSDGYARNFLLPRKLAVAATADNVNTMKLQDQARRERRPRKRPRPRSWSKAEGLPGENRRQGGRAERSSSVTTKEISAALKEQYGYQVDSKKLSCDPIKELRHLHRQVQAGL